MSELLDEIKEDLTREKYALLWQKYANYIIGIAVSIILLTGATVLTKNYLASRNSGYSDILFEANTLPKEEALKKYDDLIANSNSTYQTIAALRKASIFVSEGKNNDALAMYKKVIEEISAPQEFKDVSKLLYITLYNNMVMDTNEKDEELEKTASSYLEESIKDKSIFKYNAMELTAFHEFNSKNYTKAKDIFNDIIKSKESPQNIQVRAEEMVDMINNINTK